MQSLSFLPMPALLGGGFLVAALCLGAGAVLLSRLPARALPQPQAPNLRNAHAAALAGQPDEMSELRRQLAQAGFTGPSAVRTLNLLKLGSALLGLVLGLVLVVTVPALENQPVHLRAAALILPAMLLFLAPSRYVDMRRARYRLAISRAIPDALDFMLVCVEAGQSVDMAIKRVALELEHVHPDLSRHFSGLTEALAAGADRDTAFMKMAEDTGNDDLRQFATIVLQATSLGTPVAHTLRVFAEDLRDQRVRRIEEKANVLPTKMTMGTMFFTVPPFLILLLAPAVHRLLLSM